MPKRSKQERIEQFEQACRERGLPVTVQRRAVLEAILGREDHPTADGVYDDLKSRLHGLSRTTVYRILEMLVRLGIISKICHPGSAARFDPKTYRHNHLVCMHCEAIIDIDEAEPAVEVPWPDVRSLEFTIHDYHVHFRGICAKCRKKAAVGSAKPRKRDKRRTGKPARSGSKRSVSRRRSNP